MGKSSILAAALVFWQTKEQVLGEIVQGEEDDNEQEDHHPSTQYVGWSGAPYDHAHPTMTTSHSYDVHHMPDYHHYGGYHSPHQSPLHGLAPSAASVEHGWGHFRHALSDFSGKQGYNMDKLGYGLAHMGSDVMEMGFAVDHNDEHDHDHYDGFGHDDFGYGGYGDHFDHGGHYGYGDHYGDDWGHSHHGGYDGFHGDDWGHHSEYGYPHYPGHVYPGSGNGEYPYQFQNGVMHPYMHQTATPLAAQVPAAAPVAAAPAPLR